MTHDRALTGTSVQASGSIGRDSVVGAYLTLTESVVLHTVNSVAPDQGGTSRSVPRLVKAIREVGVPVALSVHDERQDGRWPIGSLALVHDHGLWLPSNHTSAHVARRFSIPLVVSTRGMLEPWAIAHRRWKKRVAWALYQRADLAGAAAIHATSNAEADAVRASGVRTPVAVIPNGVDVPEALLPRVSGPVRRALFLSRIHPKKGLPLLVEAWARVRPVGWELVLAGPDEGGHRAEVEALVQQAGLADAIRFLGSVADADKWALYRTADLFVLPTHSENFGIVVGEALAAGIPVLTTTGAPWHVLETERCGWWTAPTADALSAALAEVTALPFDDLVSMGERGRVYVQRELGWAGVATQMRDLYGWLLGQADQPNTVRTV